MSRSARNDARRRLRSERDDLHAHGRAYLDEPLEELGRLDRLDDDEQALTLHLRRPRARVLPTAEMGQREDHAVTGREPRLDVLVALDLEARVEIATRLVRQPEHLEPVAGVRIEGAGDGRPERVALQLTTARAPQVPLGHVPAARHREAQRATHAGSEGCSECRRDGLGDQRGGPVRDVGRLLRKSRHPRSGPGAAARRQVARLRPVARPTGLPPRTQAR